MNMTLQFSFNKFAIQSNFIIGGIVFRLDTCNISLVLKFLSMVEVFFANNY